MYMIDIIFICFIFVCLIFLIVCFYEFIIEKHVKIKELYDYIKFSF